MQSLFKRERNPYRSTSRRQHIINAVLGVVTALVVAFLVLDPQARWERANRPPPDAAACTAPGQTNCVGAILNVIQVAPSAAPAASATGR